MQSQITMPLFALQSVQCLKLIGQLIYFKQAAKIVSDIFLLFHFQSKIQQEASETLLLILLLL